MFFPSVPEKKQGITTVYAPLEPIKEPTIPGAGLIPPLHVAMSENRKLREKVEELWSYDAETLFYDYQKVDGLLVEILFRWAGLDDKQLGNINTAQGVEFFIRRIYGLSSVEKVVGNPLIGERPWPTLFSHYKARFFMLGQGKDIYKGEAIYDTRLDKIIIKGTLSKKFMNNFEKFVRGRSDAGGYINNLVNYINETKGFRKLNAEEFATVKKLVNQ